MQINFLTLHRDPVRHQYFPNAQSRDPFFDSATKTWIVTNPSHCRELIASVNLRPASYAEDYYALEKRFGGDFSNLIFAFNHIPICLHGDRHLRARRRVSEFLAARKSALSLRIPQAVATWLEPMAGAGPVELMHEVLEPLVLDIISTIIDIDLRSVPDCRNASIVFDKSIGFNKRRALEAELARLRELLAARLGTTGSEEEVGLRLALVILGKDALTGTLAQSLHKVLDLSPGFRLMDIEYPDLPPESGVPFIERMVVNPFRIAACDFAKGDRVRIFLQSLAYAEDPRSRTTFFGAGAHACLGRPLSLEIWNAIVGFLSKVPLRAQVLSYAPRTTDYVFACPETLQVDLWR